MIYELQIFTGRGTVYFYYDYKLFWNSLKTQHLARRLCSDWIDLEPIAIVSGNNHCSHCSSDSISNRLNFLFSSGHVPSADCCLDIIMADLANRVLFMLICISHATIVDFMTRRLLQRRIYRLDFMTRRLLQRRIYRLDFMTRRLLQRRIYRLVIQRMPNEHV